MLPTFTVGYIAILEIRLLYHTLLCNHNGKGKASERGLAFHLPSLLILFKIAYLCEKLAHASFAGEGKSAHPLI
jgi:hypothetical protein